MKTYIDAISATHFQRVELTTYISSTRTANTCRTYIVNDDLSFGTSPLKLMQSLNRLHQLIKQHDIEVLHANSTFSGVLLLLYKQFYRQNLRYIYTPHGYYSFKNMGRMKRVLVRTVERLINASCDKIIHVSTSEELEALHHKLVKREKSVVIFNGVEEPKPLSTNLGRAFTIVNVARVDEQKNPYGFILLADYLLNHDASVQFIWAGDGRLLEEARQQVKQLGREQSIHFIGHVESPHALLAAADLYCSTSFYEGLPFSVVEAMSHKLPLLLSDNVGHRDLVMAGKNGLLFQLGDYEAARAFVEAQQDRDTRRIAGQQSYLLFKERFHVKPMLEQLEAIYMT
ncbi:MAG: glycosyltransferase [Solibacillus sp.]